MTQIIPSFNLTPQKQLKKLQQELDKNKKLHEQLYQVNQTLKPSLNHLYYNLETKIKISYDHLSKQRKAIYELLNYDKNETLKENFVVFYQQAIAKKDLLTKYLSKVQRKERELKKKAANLEQYAEENYVVEKMIRNDHLELQRCMANLQKEKMKRLEMKNSQELSYEVKKFNSYQSSDSLNESISKTSSSLSSSSQSSHKIQPPSISLTNESFHFHPNTFNAQQIFDTFNSSNKPQSKQILHSLQKQLNPLKLNEIILLLEEQIENVKKNKLNPLMKLKKSEERRKYWLMDKENRMINRLEKMKVHIRKFKLQKFGAK